MFLCRKVELTPALPASSSSAGSLLTGVKPLPKHKMYILQVHMHLPPAERTSAALATVRGGNEEMTVFLVYSWPLVLPFSVIGMISIASTFFFVPRGALVSCIPLLLTGGPH